MSAQTCPPVSGVWLAPLSRGACIVLSTFADALNSPRIRE
jgi:hypothetical protein